MTAHRPAQQLEIARFGTVLRRNPHRTGYLSEMRIGCSTIATGSTTQAHPTLAGAKCPTVAAEATPPRPLAAAQAHVHPATTGRLPRIAWPGGRCPYILCPGRIRAGEPALAVRPSPPLAGLADQGHLVWIVGSATGRPLGDAIARDSDGAASNLCGRSSLEKAIDLIAGAAAVVSNSGLMHVAAASTGLWSPLWFVQPAYTPPFCRVRKCSALHGMQPCFKAGLPARPALTVWKTHPATVLAALDA